MKQKSQRFIPLIPQGVQCYFGEEVNRRRKVEAVLAGIMKSWGFEEIILPFFDYLESFSYGLGPELGDKAYRFLDRDGSLLALRPDLTTLVAKTAATRMSDQPLPIKLFYSGEVFRQERAGAGKQKEFYQIGLELLGPGDARADIEVLLIAVDCLLHLGVEDFKIALGHVGFFNGIVGRLSLSESKERALRDAIDHKDSAWLEREVEGLDLSIEKKQFLVQVPEFAGGGEVIDQALKIVENPTSRKALEELLQIATVMQSLGLERHLTYDLAEVRGLDYYTGIVFKIYGRPYGFEMGGGGRYDDLLGRFGWEQPAVGFSFTLDHVLPLVRDPGELHVPEHDAEENVIAVENVSVEELFQMAWQLRRGGGRVRVGRKP